MPSQSPGQPHPMYHLQLWPSLMLQRKMIKKTPRIHWGEIPFLTPTDGRRKPWSMRFRKIRHKPEVNPAPHLPKPPSYTIALVNLPHSVIRWTKLFAPTNPMRMLFHAQLPEFQSGAFLSHPLSVCIYKPLFCGPSFYLMNSWLSKIPKPAGLYKMCPKSLISQFT